VPDISQMIESKYLKQSDVPDPVIVTIDKVGRVNMAKEDEAPDYKWAIRFVEFKKAMILNSTNLNVAAKLCSSTNTDDWMGKEIVLYTDHNVSYAGQVVGGLRFRGQEKVPVKAASIATERPTGFDDMDNEPAF
jgi:hypothetical protein